MFGQRRGAKRIGVIGRARGALDALQSPATAPDPTEPDATAGVAEMLGQIGATLLAASQATSDVEETLYRLAARYGRSDLRVFVLPTLVLIEDSGAGPSQTAFFPAAQDALRLDQAGAVEELVRRAFDARTDPEVVIAGVAKIRTAEPRFGPFLSVVGYMLLTVGFGLV